MKKHLLLLCALASSGVAADDSASIHLMFQPEDDVHLRKEFLTEIHVTLEEFQIALNDDPFGTLFDDLIVTTDIEQQVVVEDSYGPFKDGRPISVDRHFKTITEEIEIASRYESFNEQYDSISYLDGTSDLEATRIEFWWEDGEYDRGFHKWDRGSDCELMRGLRENMDLRALLPDETVKVGGRWDIEVGHLVDILSPGGYLPWSLETEDLATVLGNSLDPALMGDLRQGLSNALEGDLVACLVDEEDGIATIRLEVDVESSQYIDDLSGLAARILQDELSFWSLEIVSISLEFELEGQGEAHWDTHSNHLESFEWKGEFRSNLDLSVGLGARHDLLLQVRTSLSGKLKQSVLVE